MKKIDLHIHTIATVSDSHFAFCIDKLKSYVQDAALDAIAVTNHNVFDGLQFRAIKEALFAGDVILTDGASLLLKSEAHRIAASNKAKPSVVRNAALALWRKKPTLLAGAFIPSMATPDS